MTYIWAIAFGKRKTFRSIDILRFIFVAIQYILPEKTIKHILFASMYIIVTHEEMFLKNCFTYVDFLVSFSFYGIPALWCLYSYCSLFFNVSQNTQLKSGIFSKVFERHCFHYNLNDNLSIHF